MQKLLIQIANGLTQNRSVVLVHVLSATGGSPRKTGAVMGVFEDGSTLGTIGGGKVEFTATVFAQEMLGEKHPESCLQEYALTSNEAAGIGMACGGQMLVYFQYIAPNPSTAHFFQTVVNNLSLNESLWYLLDIDHTHWCAALQNEQGVLCQLGEMTTEPYQLQNPVWESAKDGAGRLILPITGRGKVYVFGAGHVSQQLVPLLEKVDFSCIVVDNREEFANAERFPNTPVVVEEFVGVMDSFCVTKNDYIVIMTRGHMSDYDVLLQALKTPARYIGLIGSKNKINTTYDRLLQEEKVQYAQLKRITAPIGLSIGAQTPEEIAVCIAAQLIQVRHESI